MADEQRIREIAGILAATEAAGGPGAETLILPESTGLPAKPADIIDRAAEQLAKVRQKSRDDNKGRANFDAARDTLLALARTGLAKVRNDIFDLTPDEGCAMEALIIADGSRPSFILRESKVATNDPFIGEWRGALAASRSEVASLAAAVGRIQPGGGHASNFLGTGSLIDAEKGLVLTNFHVVDDAENVFGIGMVHESEHRIIVKGQLEIDFAGEAGSLKTNRFRIVEINLPIGYGKVFTGIDAAVCRIEPLEAGVLPPAVKVLSSDPDYAMGVVSSLAVIGFPGPPVRDPDANIDWDFVNETLFLGKFGIKRLSPGRFYRPLGSHPADAITRRAIGHDATSFGGASGSLVIAWLDTNAPAFALHFGGKTGVANYALAFAAVDALTAAGVRFA